jgi:hypothetical protein
MFNLPAFVLDQPFRGATHIKIYEIWINETARFVGRLGTIEDGEWKQDDLFTEQVRQLTDKQMDAFAKIVGPAFAEFADQYAHEIIYGKKSLTDEAEEVEPETETEEPTDV